MSPQSLQSRVTQTKQCLHLPLAHLSLHAVLTPSPVVIQNPADKFTSVIHLLHVDVSAPLLLQSSLPYIMLKYDERKQKQRHLSQILKGSTFMTEWYSLCISHNKYNLFTEI